MEFRASKRALIDSFMMIIFGFFIIIMPYLVGEKKGADQISLIMGVVVIAFGVYYYYKTRRLRVVIHNDRIEYTGQVKKDDRIIYFNDIYLLETIDKGGALRTFIVDKYKDGNRMVVRGTTPPATEKELGRGRDIKLDFRECASIDGKKIENYNGLLSVIAKKISKNRLSEKTENLIKSGKTTIKVESKLSQEQMKEIKKMNMLFKAVMMLDVFALLIITILIEGNSPIIINKNIFVFLVMIIAYVVNIVLNGIFINRAVRSKAGNNRPILIMSAAGIVASLCVIIPLIIKLM